MSEYLSAARAWLAQDPDAVTRDELTQLIARVEGGDAEATADLEDRFATRLAFGTAGLRGTMGVGLYRMNVHVVRHATQAFAQVILEEGPQAAAKGIAEWLEGSA